MVKVQDVITIEVTKAMEEEATRTATLKSTHTKDTWLLGRNPKERFETLYMGDLAKIALKYFLRDKGKTVIDYDEVRINNFENDDKYDLYLTQRSTKVRLEVEIKSSLEKVGDFTLAQTLQSRNLMVYPGREKDINVQAYYLPSTGKFQKVHLISWIEKKELLNFQKWSMPAQTGRERPRMQYIATLCNLKPMFELLEIIE
jgi:hypothetical protein